MLIILGADGMRVGVHRYGSGPVSGYYSRDDVQIGSATLKNYLFAEVNNTKGLGPAYKAGK